MTYKIKICGLSSLEQINMVINSKADMVGFVFAEPSPRTINLLMRKSYHFPH